MCCSPSAPGSRCGPRRSGRCPRRARLIHIDADETIFGRSYAPDLAVTADATAALRFLSSTASSTERDADFLAEGQQLRDRLEERFRHEAGPDYVAIFDTVNEHLDADTVVAADNCMAMGIAGRRLLHVQAPRRAIESRHRSHRARPRVRARSRRRDGDAHLRPQRRRRHHAQRW